MLSIKIIKSSCLYIPAVLSYEQKCSFCKKGPLMRNRIICLCTFTFLLFSYVLVADNCYPDSSCASQCYYSYPDSPFYRYRLKKDKTSQTFMFLHPAYQQTAMRQSLWHNFVYNKSKKQNNAFQLIAFYEQSIDSKSTAKYFLPFQKCNDDTTRFVAGDQAGINTQDDERIRRIRDIRAEWLGLPENFSGYFSINPQQRQAGFLIEYHTDLGKFIDIEFLKDFWLGISVPVIGAENKLNLEQCTVKNPDTKFPHDIVEAFCQPRWNFSKICSTRSTIGISEVSIRAGKAYYSRDNFQLIYFTGLSIPTSSRQDAEYMFDSYIGYNGHFGIETGLNTQIVLNKDDSVYAICFFANVETVFLFTNKQCRTFDLKCKPWSRFMQFVRKDGPPDVTCPGVNILTMKVRVCPYNMTDFSAGWRIKSENFEFEIGYSLWGHSNEKLKFLKYWDETMGFQEWGITGTYNAQTSTAVTASNSTINCQASNDHEFTPITQCDIDLNSGKARSAINHKAHFSIGALHEGNNINAFFGGGAFVELPQENTALNRWGFWLKCGAVF